MCHHHRHRSRHEAAPTTWARTVDVGADPGAGDAHRERVVEALRTHAGDGRLDPQELERRIEHAYAATYVADPRRRPARPAAPAPGPMTPRAHERREAGASSRSLAAVAVLVVVTLLYRGLRAVVAPMAHRPMAPPGVRAPPAAPSGAPRSRRGLTHRRRNRRSDSGRPLAAA